MDGREWIVVSFVQIIMKGKKKFSASTRGDEGEVKFLGLWATGWNAILETKEDFFLVPQESIRKMFIFAFIIDQASIFTFFYKLEVKLRRRLRNCRAVLLS